MNVNPLESFLDALDDGTKTDGPQSRLWGRHLGPGAIVGEKYRLRVRLAQGGMASVWEADDMEQSRVVAIKLLTSCLSEDAVSRTRFDLEAWAMARLCSPHLVRIYGYGTEGSLLYIVMERLYGEDLHERLERVGRLPLLAVGRIVEDAALALHEAHENGIVHRDLKPRNLFLAIERTGEERLKLLDFGIAKDLSRSALITRTGVIVGSTSFMSPEQIMGETSIDARADLWSLAVIIYSALTGENPFAGDLATAANKIVRGDVRSPSSICPSLPAEVDEFMARALATKRESRFRDALELADAFRNVTRSPAAAGSVPPPVDRRDQSMRITVRMSLPDDPTRSVPISDEIRAEMAASIDSSCDGSALRASRGSGLRLGERTLPCASESTSSTSGWAAVEDTFFSPVPDAFGTRGSNSARLAHAFAKGEIDALYVSRWSGIVVLCVLVGFAASLLVSLVQ